MQILKLFGRLHLGLHSVSPIVSLQQTAATQPEDRRPDDHAWYQMSKLTLSADDLVSEGSADEDSLRDVLDASQCCSPESEAGSPPAFLCFLFNFFFWLRVRGSPAATASAILPDPAIKEAKLSQSLFIAEADSIA